MQLNKRKEGQLQILVAILFFLIATVVIITAETLNDTQEQTTEQQEVQESITEQQETIIQENPLEPEQEIIPEEPEQQTDLCQDIVCEDSSIECWNNENVLCSNSCNQETGECTSCIPECLEQTQEIENTSEQEEQTNKTVEQETTDNTTIQESQNETITEQQEQNTTQENISQNTQTITTNLTNLTSGISITGDVISELQDTIQEKPVDLNIEINYKNKIKRGEIIELEATATNLDTAKNLELEWQLPDEFVVVDGTLKKNCGNEQICIFTITIQSSQSSKLGRNEIKILATYNS